VAGRRSPLVQINSMMGVAQCRSSLFDQIVAAVAPTFRIARRSVRAKKKARRLIYDGR